MCTTKRHNLKTSLNTDSFLKNIAIKWSLKITPHLKRFAMFSTFTNCHFLKYCSDRVKTYWDFYDAFLTKTCWLALSFGPEEENFHTLVEWHPRAVYGRSILSESTDLGTDLGTIKRQHITSASVSVINGCRDGWVGEEHVHQADANHPRHGLLRRRPTQLHQARLSEHLPRDELHDSRHGHAAHRLQESRQPGLPPRPPDCFFMFWKLYLQHISRC